MYNSILHFIENDIKEIENLVAAMLKGEKEPHELSQDVHDRILGPIRFRWTGYKDKETGNSFPFWIKSWGLKGIRGLRSGRQRASWKKRYRPAMQRAGVR